MSESEMAAYQAEAEAERDRIMAEFVMHQAEGYELSIVMTDEEASDDAWQNDEMSSLSAW